VTRSEAIKAYAALIGTVVVWGAAPAFVRSISLTAGPADSMFIRLVSVALMCLPFLPFCGAYIARKDWPRMLLVSWVGIFGYFLGSIYGFNYVSAGIGGIIFATQPLIILLMATAIGTDRLTAGKLFGIVVSFAGILYLSQGNLGESAGTNPVLGAACIFACGVAFSVNVVFSKPLVESYGPLRVTIVCMILTGIPAFAFYRPTVLSTVTGFGIFEWATLAYLGLIGTIFAVITWNYSVMHLRPATLGASLYAVPILAAIAGWVVLGEKLSPQAGIAGAIIIAGVAISEFGKNLSLPDHWKGLAAVIFAVCMWGMVPVGMRFLLIDLKPETAILLRLYPAAIVALIIAMFSGKRNLTWTDWVRLIAASLLGNLGYQVLAGFGIKLIPAAWTGMLFGLEPVFIALAAILFAGERLTLKFITGLAVALIGTGVLILGSSIGSVKNVSLIGVILVTLSTLGWAIYTTLIRPVTRKHGAVPIACLSIAITGIPTLGLLSSDVTTEIQNLNGQQWLIVASLSIFATVFAIVAWNYALGKMDNTKAGMFLYVQPIVAAAGGILLLGESPSVWLFGGGALILAGVAISQMKSKAAERQEHGYENEEGLSYKT
jgi:drug/metabolite transporter (DMT)-like permease